MSYKTTIHKQFGGKGFVDVDNLTFISTNKNDNGVSYDLQEAFSKIAGEGDEVQFTVKLTETTDTVEDEE